MAFLWIIIDLVGGSYMEGSGNVFLMHKLLV